MLSWSYLKTAGVVVLILITLTSISWGSSGLSVSPGSVDIKMQSPQIFQGEISVTNIGDSTLSVKVNPKRMLKNANTTLYADDGIATWISIDPAEFNLAPGEKKSVKYSINIPTNVNYYDAMGALQIVGTPPDLPKNQTGGLTTQIKQATAVVVPVIVGYPGQILESISLVDQQVPWALLSLMPTNLEYKVKNNGTVQAKMTNKVTVKGLFENQNFTVNGTVFPGDENTLKTQWTPGFFDMGVYDVESNINYGREQQTQNLQTKNTIFVFPSWLIIVIVILLIGWQIRKRDIKSPIRIKIEKK